MVALLIGYLKVPDVVYFILFLTPAPSLSVEMLRKSMISSRDMFERNRSRSAEVSPETSLKASTHSM
ncbi:MAG TPA: hypothetical protein DIW81_00420 [Planctomycetaceae bacterium]|nr:hypothetical protein [Rubinisphaera sp.]HCS50048.1 hypothetical protein [Planctomycetaceae bacterium]|tara:strand:+ start:9231 stop:9431 length:201 start_codon:yes stop_codon:yes gene_type:complete